MTHQWFFSSPRVLLGLLCGLVLATQSCSCEQTCVANDECSEGACVEGVCDPDVAPCSLCGDNENCSDEGECLGTCASGFVFDDGACVALPEGCDDCATQNRGCDAAGECGDCLEDHQEFEGNCVPHMSCDPPPAEDSLVEHCEGLGRDCSVTVDGALCGDCLSGYLVAGDECVLERSCSDADLTAECAEQNRECVEDPNGHCGECLPFALPEEDGEGCRDVVRCTELTCDTACTPETETTDAFCSEPCTGATGNDGVTNAQGACVECGACDGAGEDGPYLVALYEGTRCICRSQPGHYFDGGFGETRQCDQDGDGWTRKSAQQAYESPDTVLQATFNCDVRVINSFELRSHDGQTKTVPLQNAVPLFEENKIDSQLEMDLPPRFVDYGGRSLLAEELNSLTKVCAAPDNTNNWRADFNVNGIDDYEEFHGMDLGATTIHTPFISHTYFVELHRGWYEDGKYVIEEKSRSLSADAGRAVPLTIPEGAEGEFWRQCTVYQDPNYVPDRNLGRDLTTYDFAAHASDDFTMGHHSQFKCMSIVSSLPTNSAPHETLKATLGSKFYVNECGAEGSDETPISSDAIGDPRNPKDPVVSCATVTDLAPLGAGDVVWGVRRYETYTSPIPTADDGYNGGCVNECVEFKSRCPGYDADFDAKTKCAGIEENFGELTCGCDYNYGGLDCDYGCPSANLLYADDYSLAPRSGYWMCGGVVASSNPDLAEAGEPVDDDGNPLGYRLRGGVPAVVTPTGVLCETDPADGETGCGSGWSLGPAVLP